MSSVLPEDKVKATRVNPKMIITYGMPKVGKTTILNELESNLILDMEGGAESIDSLRLPVKYIDGPTLYSKEKSKENEIVATSYNTVFKDICQYGADLVAKGLPVKFPYRRISLDTGDKFEEMCEVTATLKYRNTVLGKSFDGGSVIELPKGAGYGLLRNEVVYNLEMMSKVCETLILNCHTKDKITDKGGVEISSKDLSLTGKLGSILCAKADMIIYLYREPGKPLMGSLETYEGGVMGARKFPHLEGLYGTRFEFAWSKLLVDPK